MRKTFVYILLLAILGFGVYYFLFSNRNQSFATSESDFTIKDTAAIGKIFLAGPNGMSILLERTDSCWMVNKRYKALYGTLKVLMTTLTKQVPVTPVHKGVFNNAVEDLAANGIKVEIYNRSGEKMRVFYVGGQASGIDGSYMLIDGAKTPYVVNLPGFHGYITPVYSYKLKDWRDRTVFNTPPDQIESVSVRYPGHEENSFVFKNEQGKYSVIADKSIMTVGAFNERRARVYSKYFQNLNCEGYINHDVEIDSILHTMPERCSILLKTTKGQQQQVDVYWLPLNRRSKNMGMPDPGVDNDKYDADHFYAVINNFKDTVIITSNVFNKVFRKAYEFYQPDAVPDQTPAPAVEEHKDQPLLPIPPKNITK